MKLPRDLSGSELIAYLLKHWGYVKVHQVGSHAICKQKNLHITASLFQRTTPCG